MLKGSCASGSVRYEIRGELHFMLGSKVPWLEIADTLDRKGGGPPFGERD